MGRDKRNEKRSEHWTQMIRSMMEEPAWRALSPNAQAAYPWLKLEWRGPNANNNGKIRLSVRQLAQRMGTTRDTAARAIHQLQAKGFVVIKTPACLGTSGAAKAPELELTELALPGQRDGRKLYRDWKPTHEFPVVKASANNPGGHNGKTKPRPESRDDTVIDIMTKRGTLS